MNLLASDEPAGLEERIDAALETTDRAWKRREGAWIIPASERLPREIRIAAQGDHVRIEAILMSWDEIGTDETRALDCLLHRAQFDLRFARCELDERQARIAAVVEASLVERDLPEALSSVVMGSRLLAREVGVLLAPQMARTYLAFLDGDSVSRDAQRSAEPKHVHENV
jgi:hypothetical protein